MLHYGCSLSDNVTQRFLLRCQHVNYAGSLSLIWIIVLLLWGYTNKSLNWDAQKQIIFYFVFFDWLKFNREKNRNHLSNTYIMYKLTLCVFSQYVVHLFFIVWIHIVNGKTLTPVTHCWRHALLEQQSHYSGQELSLGTAGHFKEDVERRIPSTVHAFHHLRPLIAWHVL